MRELIPATLAIWNNDDGTMHLEWYLGHYDWNTVEARLEDEYGADDAYLRTIEHLMVDELPENSSFD